MLRASQGPGRGTVAGSMAWTKYASTRSSPPVREAIFLIGCGFRSTRDKKAHCRDTPGQVAGRAPSGARRLPGFVQSAGVPLSAAASCTSFQTMLIAAKSVESAKKFETPTSNRGNDDGPSVGVSVIGRGGRRGAEHGERSDRKDKPVGNKMLMRIAKLLAFMGKRFLGINKSKEPAESVQPRGSRVVKRSRSEPRRCWRICSLKRAKRSFSPLDQAARVDRRDLAVSYRIP